MAIHSNSEQQKTYLVTGGSGFIGRRLCQGLIDNGHNVIIVSRNLNQTAKLFDPQIVGRQITLLESIEQLSSSAKIDVIINLAGEPLAASRWNEKSKARFVSSRINMTKSIVSFLQRLLFLEWVLPEKGSIRLHTQHQ